MGRRRLTFQPPASRTFDARRLRRSHGRRVVHDDGIRWRPGEVLGDSQASFATFTEFGVRDDLVSLFVAHGMTARASSAPELFLSMGLTLLRVEACVPVSAVCAVYRRCRPSAQRQDFLRRGILVSPGPAGLGGPNGAGATCFGCQRHGHTRFITCRVGAGMIGTMRSDVPLARHRHGVRFGTLLSISTLVLAHYKSVLARTR